MHTAYPPCLPAFHPPAPLRLSSLSSLRHPRLICAPSSATRTVRPVLTISSCARLSSPSPGPSVGIILPRSVVAAFVAAYLVIPGLPALAQHVSSPLPSHASAMESSTIVVADVVAEPLTLNDAKTTTSSSSSSSSNLIKADEAALREQSRRNTRVSGRLSQLFSQARRAAEAGDLDGALSLYNDLVSQAPTFAPGYSNRGNILVTRARFSEAVSDYSRALELAPLDRDAWLLYVNRGCARLALGDGARVVLEEDFNVAYAQRGDDPVILANRAAAFESLDKWDAAIRDYQAALKGNDVQPFWLKYGLALFQRGRSVEAVAIIKRVATKYSVDDVRAALAAVYFDRGDVAAAETQWSGMERPRSWESRSYLQQRKWPPRAIEAMDRFRQLKE